MDTDRAPNAARHRSGGREVRLSDRYAVGRVIAHGGMGQVRHARDLRLGRDVAVKVLRLGASSDADRLRFEREARAAARINHPNVVAVYDVGEQDGEVFIVMERLPGTTLAEEIAQGPLPLARVDRVATELLGALAAAHEQGVLHRDIKPSNVLFTRDGAAKLGDFGIAKTGDDTDLTEIGSLVGTAAYLAPERLSGEPATVAADLYSVGVLLYEALTGARPFDGATPVAVAHAMSTAHVIPVAQRRPDCPPALAATIARSLHKDPAARFASASSMADAIAGGSSTVVAAPATGLTAATHPPASGIVPTAPTVASPLAPTLPAADALAPTVAFGPRGPGARPARRGVLLVGALAALVAGIILIGVLAARPGDEPLSPPATAVATDAPTTGPPTTPTTPTPTSTTPTTVAPVPSTTSPPPPAPADAKPGKGKGKGGKSG